MAISLPVAPGEIAEELDYERGRLIFAGADSNEVRRSILPGGVRVGHSGRFDRFLGGGWFSGRGPGHVGVYPFFGAPAL